MTYTSKAYAKVSIVKSFYQGVQKYDVLITGAVVVNDKDIHEVSRASRTFLTKAECRRWAHNAINEHVAQAKEAKRNFDKDAEDNQPMEWVVEA